MLTHIEANKKDTSAAAKRTKRSFSFKIGLTLLALIAISTASNLYADKYAGEIFRIGAGVRNFALGNNGVADFNSTALAYWNPSLLTKSTGSSFELMHSEEFMGIVTYDIFSAVWGGRQRYAVTLSRIGVNDIPLTRLPDPDAPVSPENKPYKYKTVNNADYIAYFGLYRRFGDYAVGFTPKVAYRHLAETGGFGFGADISTHFDINEHLLVGINVRDFFTTRIFWENGTHETVKPGVDLGTRISIANPLLENRASLFLGTEIMTEGRDTAAAGSIGFLSFDYQLGIEVPMPDYVTLFAGYDVENFTCGVSVHIAQYLVNYAFKHNAELDNSHRISIGLSYR